MYDYDDYRILMELGQVGVKEAGGILRCFLRGSIRETAIRVISAEVEMLCGEAYQPGGGCGYQRAGSAPGSILYEGRKQKVKRPRIRKKISDGKTEEARLQSYEAAREPGYLHEMLLRAMVAGVSTREQKNVYPDASSISKSSVSRLWVREGRRIFEEFRARSIIRPDWLVLMLDGVVLSKELTAIVALGIAEDGTKHMLDFEVGASENAEVAGTLVSRLAERGFAPKAGCRLLSVFDGSKALRKAVAKQWDAVVFQRCLIHKERNLRSYLPRRDWGELARLMKRIRNAQGPKAGREALAELKRFVGKRNAEALASLNEAGDDLIALHLLDVPNTLHKSLLSTNLIENSINNIRRKTNRVTRWRSETEQARRWMAMALFQIEKGFRRIAGYRHMKDLAAALAATPEVSEEAA